MPESWRAHKIAGVDWLRGFRQRNSDLSLRRPELCSLARATAFHRVRYNGQDISVCPKAFQNLHGITKSRLERLQQHLPLGNATPPIDRRGLHQDRANKLPVEITAQIREHILSFPKYK
ncbi:hypothetical protein NQ315_006094 [Exocentrus adspersus]|uniref:Uncharacterized protein n=1 Tax=Exocentrus adspersus TaxID=1586481 RepID=A0AAV8VE76_9CUCU|nr:hypothetical protein NQ315_006094 [Exocentrus adspersus]